MSQLRPVLLVSNDVRRKLLFGHGIGPAKASVHDAMLPRLTRLCERIHDFQNMGGQVSACSMRSVLGDSMRHVQHPESAAIFRETVGKSYIAPVRITFEPNLNAVAELIGITHPQRSLRAMN